MDKNSNLKLFDVAANLSDEQFNGIYHGKTYHKGDIDEVIKRSQLVGCSHLLVASGHLDDLVSSLEICQLSDKFYTTGGIHPCRASEPYKSGDVKKYWEDLELQIQIGISQRKLIAIGECGLDYDRLHYSPKDQQLQVFPPHFGLAEKYGLPMYLHNRNTGNDFFDLVVANRSRFPGGLVHSFTGPQEELEQILKLDLFVGVNGCSLKTKENMDVAKNIPLDKLMLETDAPYCDIKNTHESMKHVKTKLIGQKPDKFIKGKMVKGRNEPCSIVQVLEVMAVLKNISEENLAKICFENTLKFFQLSE